MNVKRRIPADLLDVIHTLCDSYLKKYHLYLIMTQGKILSTRTQAIKRCRDHVPMNIDADIPKRAESALMCAKVRDRLPLNIIDTVDFSPISALKSLSVNSCWSKMTRNIAMPDSS